MRTIESPITIDGERVIIRPAVGEIWMTKHEIARLFGCFVAKVVSNIPAILKSGVLHESRVCRFHRYKDGSGVELFNFEMITALAFRIDTHNAAIFRGWLMERATQPANTIAPPIAVLLPVKENRLPN